MEHPIIKITVKDYGTMTAELYPELAPLTVANFLKLIEEKFFDGLIFHRVIKGFMLQGGGYDERMQEKRAAPIRGEFAANGFRQNTLKHVRGVLSMARTSDPNSASSQFFIMHKDCPQLDGKYAAFGTVTKGIEVVDAIASVQTNFYDAPLEKVTIKSIKIED